jgi:hypothetical protein
MDVQVRCDYLEHLRPGVSWDQSAGKIIRIMITDIRLMTRLISPTITSDKPLRPLFSGS